jgi:cytidylate kinase
MSFAEKSLGREEVDEGSDSPRHGYRGDRPASTARPDRPASLTITVSREAGSRGNTIGNRVGMKLGWPVYNQELLQYMAQEWRQSSSDNPEAVVWAAARLEELVASGRFHADSSMKALARTILMLAYQGEIVIIGRGAGCILPAESTLNVRIVAALADRVAYMSQWLRLTQGEAAEQVTRRDAQRSEFLASHFERQANDVYQYDMTLNSSLLGEELCADLVIQAARSRLAQREPHAKTQRAGPAKASS